MAIISTSRLKITITCAYTSKANQHKVTTIRYGGRQREERERERERDRQREGGGGGKGKAKPLTPSRPYTLRQ